MQSLDVSSNIIRMIISRRMRWIGQVARMRNAYNIFFEFLDQLGGVLASQEGLHSMEFI
jgi:hypothetical protein